MTNHPTHIEDDEYADAPVGTRLRDEDYEGGAYLEKIGHNQWQRYDAEGSITSGRITTDNDWSDRREVIRWGRASSPARQFTIGHRITTVEEYDQLPDGAEIAYNHSRNFTQANARGEWHCKVNGEWFYIGNRSNEAPPRPSPDVFSGGYLGRWFVVALPEQPFNVGDPVTSANIDMLPVGTRITRLNSSSGWWVKQDDGWHEYHRDDHEVGGRPYPSDEVLNMGRQRFIVSLPNVINMSVDLTPGRRVSIGELDTLPDGTRLCFHMSGDFGESSASLTGSRVEKVNGVWYRINRTTEQPTTAENRPTEEGWMILHGPSSQASHPAVGEHVTTREHIRSLPVGSVLRSNGGRLYVKTTDDDTWYYCDDQHRPISRYGGGDDFSLNRYNTVVQVGPGEPTAAPAVGLQPVEERVEQAKADVEVAINECVAGNGHAYAKDGGFWVLGISEPPPVGTDLYFGSAFGLPIGSLVGRDGTVWRVVSHDDRYPEHLAGPQMHMPRDSMVELVALGDPETITYTGYNHFLHTVWERERQMRQWHDWCTAVEMCLTDRGLDDPGDTPDEAMYTQPPVGTTFTSLPTSAEQRQLNGLPVGSIITHDTDGKPFVKTRDGWFDCRDQRVDNSIVRCRRITVSYIHNV